jgi:hypothetical protein
MVQHKSYIPTGKYEFEKWMLDFVDTTKENVGSFGITKESSADIKKLVDDLVNCNNREKRLIDEKRKQVKLSQAVLKSAQDACRKQAQIIKANPAYTDAVGKDFDIIGAEVHVDTDTATPILKAKKVPHGWEFSFGLNSYFSGVNIYRKRPDQDKFHYLASDTRSPYVDNQDMVNGTQYYAYFILGDTEVGQKSNIVTIDV